MALITWTVLTVVTWLCPSADVQMAMPMYPMMSPFRLPYGMGPPPMPMPMPPPMPYPQIAIAAFAAPRTTPKPKPKPPPKTVCPPCYCYPCMPFVYSFCSPCHLQCSCKEVETEAPTTEQPKVHVAVAFPPPMFGPMPPPVMIMPVPPMPVVATNSDTSSYSSSSSDHESCEYPRGGFKRYVNTKKRNRKKRIYRRMFGKVRKNRKGDIVSPVLSYVNEDGDVKFRTRVSDVDAAKLLSEKRSEEESQKMNIKKNVQSKQRNG